jgi:hypothetical protein
MTAERIKGLLTIQCDDGGCRNFFEGGGSFSDVWNEAKSEGWRAKQIAGEWFHYCDACSKPYKPSISKLMD